MPPPDVGGVGLRRSLDSPTGRYHVVLVRTPHEFSPYARNPQLRLECSPNRSNCPRSIRIISQIGVRDQSEKKLITCRFAFVFSICDPARRVLFNGKSKYKLAVRRILIKGRERQRERKRKRIFFSQRGWECPLRNYVVFCKFEDQTRE